jgi:hypothetical protein
MDVLIDDIDESFEPRKEDEFRVTSCELVASCGLMQDSEGMV